ncbi:MAG: 4-hydroxythreonine-4-phosphate dehydrogenase PdxA [Pseudomonadota bacterium]|nr:4-hydroxythreonine-4-phosphate dehydrogenase PdxA [Pseudomonadota bacterium]
MTRNSAPIFITCGEPAGVGAEIVLKAKLRRADLPPVVLHEAPERVAAIAADHDWPIKVVPIERLDQASGLANDELAIYPLAFPAPPTPGRLDTANASTVIDSIRRAVDLVGLGEAAAMVTLPIQKKVLYDAGFSHPGHTEFLAELAGVDSVAMMLAVPGLRVVPATIHMPLAKVPAALTTEGLIAAGALMDATLRRDFAIARPRLVVTGLNPHAGEDGTLGDEEITIIAPAIAALRQRGVAVEGPVSADTLFHGDARVGFDAALCMYHDQALIPLKTIDFWRGVNITLGLPFIRTSPDHGTALALAGRGTADPRSLIAAIDTAAEMAASRAR